jgi:hypothetical protein
MTLQKLKATTIPAGYRLTIKSWENDGDAKQTVIVNGLTEARAAFYVDLCKFCSDQFGNLYCPSKKERDLADSILTTIMINNNMVEKGNEKYVTDHARDYMYELGLCGGEYYSRQCEDWKVEYLPEPLTMEDVTDRFN